MIAAPTTTSRAAGPPAPTDATARRHGRARYERLSVGDLMTFWAESPGSPMHIALATIIENPAGAGVDVVRDELRSRTAAVRDFSQHVRWTHLGEGPPLLVDDAGYRFADHVCVLDPLSLDDAAAFDRLAAARAVVPLDHDRPLWRADLVPDTASSRVGLILVMHHAIADGMRGMALAATLLDAAPAPSSHAGALAVPRAGPEPTRADLVVDNLRRLGDALAYLAEVLRPTGGDRRGWHDLRASMRELRTGATRTRADGPASAARDLTVVHRPLDLLRTIAHRHGATVNDVLLAAVSGGMRELLLAHGDRVDGRSLRVSIPVASPPGARNAGGTMPIVTSLPVGDPDPVARLDAIHRDLAERKARRDRSYRGVGQSPLMPRSVMRLLTTWMRTRGSRLVNLYVTNIPGPPVPLWLGEGKVTRPVPIAPLVAGGRISIAAMSYAGELALSVHTDHALDHHAALVGGIEATLDELERAASRPGT